MELDSLKVAETYYYNSLLIEQLLKNTEGIAYAQLGIVSVEMLADQKEEAKKRLDEVSDQLSSLDNDVLMFRLNLLYGDYYTYTGSITDAIEYYQKGLAIAESKSLAKEKLQALEKLYLFYKGQQDFKTAFTYFEKYNENEKSLNNVEISSRIEELQYRFDLDKKEAEIFMLKKEKEINSLRLDKERSMKNYLFVTLSLIGLFFVTNIRGMMRRKQ